MNKPSYDEYKAKTAEGMTQGLCGQSNTNPSIGGYADEPQRDSLRERVKRTIAHKQRQQSTLSSLYELSELLEKNADTARILELLEITGER